jgi:hypothetical protein
MNSKKRNKTTQSSFESAKQRERERAREAGFYDGRFRKRITQSKRQYVRAQNRKDQLDTED